MRAARGHVVLLFISNPWAYRIGGRGRTRLLASLSLARTGRARETERERERVRCRVVSFTKKLARGEAASGDEDGISGTRRLPFSLSDREMNFAYSGLNLIRKPHLSFMPLLISL